MKTIWDLLAVVFGSSLAGAQGTFVYDQQDTNVVDGTICLSQQPKAQGLMRCNAQKIPHAIG